MEDAGVWSLAPGFRCANLYVGYIFALGALLRLTMNALP